MKIFKLFIGAFLIFSTSASAQFFGPARSVIRLISDPSPCTAGQIWYNNTSSIYKGCAGGSASSLGTGTVTSVAASVPAYMAVTGSPITTSGTLAFLSLPVLLIQYLLVLVVLLVSPLLEF
jgi:hypothetical protein